MSDLMIADWDQYEYPEQDIFPQIYDTAKHLERKVKHGLRQLRQSLSRPCGAQLPTLRHP